MESEKLTLKEKRDLVIQTGLQAIPYIGGTLSSAYFGYKQEIRFKRLEKFYEGLAKRMENIESQQVSFDTRKEDMQFIQTIEKLNDQIEKEIFEEKLVYYENYFINLVSSENDADLNQQYFYLELLNQLSIEEIYLILDLSDGIVRKGYYFISDDGGNIANVYKTINLGLVKQRTPLPSPNSQYQFRRSDSLLAEYDYSLSRLGWAFYNYCLDPNPLR